jgi:pimeloyl-ACP methyl ester carboxylesterase
MGPEGIHVVRYHEDATGPPVVLVHGAPDRSKNFAPVVEHLDDLPVVVYDRRGYGHSSIASGVKGVGFDVHANDLIGVLTETPSIVVAHSAGSAIAMFTAARAPELFLALGVWEPPMTAWDWSSRELRELSLAYGRSTDPGAAIESFNRTLALGDAGWEQLRESTRDRLRAEGEAFCADMASQESKFIELDDLRVPGLVGCGDEWPDGVDINARTADEAGFEFLVIEGTGHFAPITHPEAWARFVRATVELAERASGAQS